MSDVPLLVAAAPAGAAGSAAVESAPGGPMIVIGLFLLGGVAAHVLGERTSVPRVSLLLLVGVLAGPGGLGLAPEDLRSWFPFAAQLALSIVGFELGERFLRRELERSGRAVITVALGVSLGTAVLVFGTLALIGVPLVVAILLGGIATATDPAATADVVEETRARGPVSSVILGIAAIDDAIGVILFSLLAVVAGLLAEGGLEASSLLHALREAGGGLAIGGAFGVPMAYLTGRIRPGELTRLETLGFVLAASGTAAVAGASPLIASIALGATVANLARHHTRPFHEIRNVREPFLVVFFVLAGFHFSPGDLLAMGPLATGYVLARIGGRILGAWAGARLAGAPPGVRRHAGLCLMPQAGVALGMALLAGERFPEHADRIIALMVGTTFLFEVVGPIVTRIELRRAGEAGRNDAAEAEDEEDAASAEGDDAGAGDGEDADDGDDARRDRGG